MDTVTEPVRRDRFGRPYIVPPEGDKGTPYTRATTVSSTLDDRWALEAWKQRMTALGIADRPDLLLAVTAHRDDKGKLNSICEDAIEAAKGKAAATTGTAIHALTEVVDRGQELPVIPDSARADLDAYTRVTEALEVVAIEQLVVLDEHRIAGTPDRIFRYQGENYIGDLKTGSTLKWGAGSIAAQLAIYSRGVGYDPATGERTPLPDVNQNNGIVVHVPAGTGTAQLYWVDLGRGWVAVETALWVRKWRKANDLLVPFTP